MTAVNFRNALLGAAGLAFAALGPGAFAQEMTAADEVEPSTSQSVHLYVIAGNDLAVQIEIDSTNAGERPTTVTVTRFPLHGDYLGQAWPSFTYKPAAGFFGYDQLALEIQSGWQSFNIEYEITVLPARIPLAGRWNGDQYRWPGLYDPQGGWLQQCTGTGNPETDPETGAVYQPLICSWSRVLGAPPAAYAFLMPAAPGSADQVALFAPATGTLYQLLPSGTDYLAVASQEVPEAAGRFPVAGVFRAGEPVTVAFVGRQGQVGRIESGGRWADWARPFEMPRSANEELVWPVVLPFAGADGLALVEAETGDLQMLGPNGERHLWACNQTPLDTRRPFGAARGVKTAVVSTLVAEGRSLFVSDLFYGTSGLPDPSPQTYPLKFPDDPP